MAIMIKVYKKDMKELDINTESLEDLAADRMMMRSTHQHLKSGEEKLMNTEVGKRPAERSATTPTVCLLVGSLTSQQ